MIRPTVWLFSAPLMLSLALPGCGDSSPSAPASSAETAAASGVRACDVLTQADAEKALGQTVQRMPNDGGPAALDICQYGYHGERLADVGNVSVTLKPIDIASVRKGVVDAGETPEPVEGLGDSAFWSPNYGLYVGKGNRTAIYLLGANGLTDTKARSIDLARATSSRF